MLKVQEIRELIKLIDQSNIDEFSYEYDGAKIKMKKKLGEVSTAQVKQVIQEMPTIQQAQQVQPVAVEQVIPQPPLQESVESVEQDKRNLHSIISPMVGTFYQASSPDVPAYVKVGDKVSKDSIVCIVEAMKLFNEIEAEVSGEVIEVLVKDGQLVEYGQPLFLVKPE